MSRHPEVKWAEREDKVYITVLLPDSKNAKVNLSPDGLFSFSATAGPENHLYELKLDLCDKVNVEESKINIGVRSIFCVIEKSEKQWWKKLLNGDQKAPHYVKVDWDKWADDDEEKDHPEMDLDGMDFSKFGGADGLGDMGDDLDDSDDEDQEVEGPGEQKTEKSEGEVPETKTETAPSA